MIKRLTILSAIVLLSFVGFSQRMDYDGLTKTLQHVCDSASGGDGAWQILYRGRVMMLIADDTYNRMRIISPIVETPRLESDEYKNALLANFHSVLDAKYAISDDIMWSVFIHPLKELSTEQLTNAIEQVYLAAETFGTTYQSTDLIFPLPPEEEKKQEQKTKEPKKQKL